MPVLVVQLLSATPFEGGAVKAAQFVPYAVLGLIAGVYTDRWRRKPVLVWASVGRALSLGATTVLWLVGELQIWMLVIALLSFGAFSVLDSPPPPVHPLDRAAAHTVSHPFKAPQVAIEILVRLQGDSVCRE
jgi:MFS family permease